MEQQGFFTCISNTYNYVLLNYLFIIGICVAQATYATLLDNATMHSHHCLPSRCLKAKVPIVHKYTHTHVDRLNQLGAVPTGKVGANSVSGFSIFLAGSALGPARLSCVI